MNKEQEEQYLKRIGLKGPLQPTAETLSLLQQAHLVSICYYHLDLFYIHRVNKL